MEKEALISHLIKEFEILVEDIIPENEVGFKKYAKENLNPAFHLPPDTKLTTAIKSLNKGIVPSVIKFEGSGDTQEDQLKYQKWSFQLSKLFIPTIVDSILNDPTFNLKKTILFNEKVNDLLSEIAFQLPPNEKPSIQQIAEYVNEKAKKSIDVLPKNLHYWEHEPTKLIELYDELLLRDLIEPNENFMQSFSTFETRPAWKTIWKKEPENQTSLFALLYLIYGKCNTFKNEPIGLIAHKLFKLKNSTSSLNSIKTAFSQFTERNKKGYLIKNHNSIVQLVLNLEIDK